MYSTLIPITKKSAKSTVSQKTTKPTKKQKPYRPKKIAESTPNNEINTIDQPSESTIGIHLLEDRQNREFILQNAEEMHTRGTRTEDTTLIAGTRSPLKTSTGRSSADPIKIVLRLLSPTGPTTITTPLINNKDLRLSEIIVLYLITALFVEICSGKTFVNLDNLYFVFFPH